MLQAQIRQLCYHENVRADTISKSVDCDDWEIDTSIFSHLNSVWGPHTVDRFASDYNTKCTIFNSKHYCPGTSGINAFDQHWGRENNWVVPPQSLAGKCLQKLILEQANGTLVIPYWTSAPYWPLLYTRSTTGVNEYEDFIVESKVMSSDIIVRGRGRNGIFGKTDAKFNMLVLKIRF